MPARRQADGELASAPAFCCVRADEDRVRVELR